MAVPRKQSSFVALLRYIGDIILYVKKLFEQTYRKEKGLTVWDGTANKNLTTTDKRDWHCKLAIILIPRIIIHGS